MSDQLTKPVRRPYRKRRRAEQEEETRLRITEAAVDLHGSVGPARTTMKAVAERAGVQRSTLYRYFPDEEALFGACSSHWAAANPLPDTASWERIADPDERLATALAELYAWFAQGEEMIELVTRDAPTVPAMRQPVEAIGAWFEMATGILLHGRPERGSRRRRVKAAIGHAISFPTWRSLVRGQGLSQDEAVAVMLAFVAATRA